MNKKNNIKKILQELSLIDDKSIEVFSKSTRDNSKLNVYRDTVSNVIFIDNYFVGNKEYEEGTYKEQLFEIENKDSKFQDINDTERRIKSFFKYSNCFPFN